MRGKKRPQSDRTRALGIAVLDGAAAASQQTGIPENTVRTWMESSEFVELRERTKEQVAAEWWGIVQQGFRRVGQLLNSSEDVQKVATATAIVTDKMLLIRGEATGRTETRSLTDTFDDHELELLRAAVQREAAAESAPQAGMALPGTGEPAPSEG